MFDDTSTSYLNESAGNISGQVMNQQGHVTDSPSAVNEEIDKFDLDLHSNPNHPSSVSPQTDAGFEPYWKRTRVAPYSSHYTPPKPIPSTFDVNTSMGHIEPENKQGMSSFQNGILMSSLIIVGAVAGYSLESRIQSKLKSAGYGSLIGAVAANAIRYGISSGLTFSLKDGAKGLLGASIPLLPVVLSMYTKKPLKNGMVYFVGGTSAIMGSYIIFDSLKRKFLK